VGENKWKVIYTARPAAGDPQEGREAEHAAKQWRGEEHTVAFNEDYPRMPRVELKNPGVIADTLEVALKRSGQKLTLTDYTGQAESAWYQNWPIPPKFDAYVHRQQGDDFSTCYIYFNPDLENEQVDVAYDYFLTGAEIRSPVVFDGCLYFNETGDRHRFVKIYREGGATKLKNTYSPRAGDRELACITAGDGRLWGISAPSYLLVHFAKEWSGYVHEVDGAGKKIWSVVADLARAGDQYCFDRLGTLYVVNRATPTRTGTFPHILRITRKDLPPYEKVAFSYANGKVERGSGKPELSLSSNYVYDKGHAEILCRKAYEYYTVRRREYVVECAGVLEQINLCEEKTFEYLGKPAGGIIVGRQFSPQGTTTFTVVERVAQGEGAGAGGGGSTQEA
jgi:hypothetical protein